MQVDFSFCDKVYDNDLELSFFLFFSLSAKFKMMFTLSPVNLIPLFLINFFSELFMAMSLDWVLLGCTNEAITPNNGARIDSSTTWMTMESDYKIKYKEGNCLLSIISWYIQIFPSTATDMKTFAFWQSRLVSCGPAVYWLCDKMVMRFASLQIRVGN